MLTKINQRLRVRAIVLAGVICVFAVWTPPARSQAKPKAEEAKVEEAQPAAKGDPKAATTTKELDIPVDELRVLVKPLTLDELQNEAAGWMLLVQTKAKEISQAEVVIKRQNLAITQQQEGAKALEEAQKALEEAEKIQKTANPGSPEYEESAKKVEAAKESFKKAQESVDQAKTTKAELKEDKTLQAVQEKAKETGDLDKAKQTLDEMKTAREKMTAGSLDYEEATKKIDKLDVAIKALEDAQTAQKAAKPNSPEYTEATQQVDKAQGELKQLLQQQGVGTTDQSTKQSSQNLDRATATLENIKIDNSGQEKQVAGLPGVVNDEQNLQQKQQQLENTTEQLKKSAETESDTKNQLVATVTELQAQLTAIIDRFNVILDELEKKGGKAVAFREYIQAVSAVELDTKDTEGLGLRLLGWAQSDEGGMRWVNNTGKFLGVFVTSIVVAQILGTLLNLLLSKVGGTSVLMRQFMVMTIKRGGIVLGFMLALTALEVSLGPILALLGGVSFVLAFALQSNLGNLASGLMIMAYKPFDIGDEIKIGGLWGWVDSITLANTKIKGFSGQIFNVPNNTVWGDTIENLSGSETRKVKVNLQVGFDDDLKNVEQLLVDIMKSHPQVLETPAPSASVFNIENYYFNVSASCWAKKQEFWGVNADIVRMIQERFNKEGINIGAIPKNIEIVQYSNGNGNGKIPHLVSETPVHRMTGSIAQTPEDLADVMEPEPADF
ncbi:MAG: mechanosensitive ion channel domain-containing protein [Microcoleus sp.]|uniref:mechanosensitive ion channel family protein n=1 Tax=Microcoleus sp. TaxID=44472 RepID=UPI003C7828D3